MRLKMNFSRITVIFFLVTSVLASLTGLKAGDRLRIVTTTPDLASIAKEIGGERVETFAIAKGYQDPHFVDAKPSYIIELQKADMFIQMGLDLEIGWAPPLLDGARNPDILPGGKGYLDASAGVPLLQVPTGDPATLRAQGDIHIYGNPHYWLDPLRGKIIARNIFGGLARLQPENRAEFQKNLDLFDQKLDQEMAKWEKQMQPYRGTKIVAFHNSWPYFEERFGLQIVGFIEPKPGIPPTPKHLVEVIKTMQEQNVKIIIISPYYSQKSSELVASKTGAKVLELATSVEAFPGINDYFALFDYNLGIMLQAFQESGNN